MATRLYLHAVDAPAERSGQAYWFVFQGDRLLVVQRDNRPQVLSTESLEDLGIAPQRTVYLGTLDGQHCFGVEIARDAPLPDGMAADSLRALWDGVPEDLFALAGRAVQLLTWDRTHQYCGQCGTHTESMQGERVRHCPQCGLNSYPRISPAVIVLVTKGDAMLLTRGLQFPSGFYGVLAGFVEAGESLEEAVVREIQEEAGIEVAKIRYFGSQPWPFPHQMMVGFTAEWAAGEIRVDPTELADAAWFTRETLPNIPPPFSIARRLIDAFLDSAH